MGRSRFGVRITAALALSGLALVNAQSAEEQMAGLQQQCNAMIGERDQAMQQMQQQMEQMQGQMQQQMQAQIQQVQSQMEGQIGQLNQSVEGLTAEKADLEAKLAAKTDAPKKEEVPEKTEAECTAEKEKLDKAKAEKEKIAAEKEKAKAKFEKLLSKKDEDLSTCSEEKTQLLAAQESSCSSVQTVGLGVDFEKGCERCTVDLSLFTKIGLIAYKNMVAPYYDDISEVYNTQLTLISAMTVEYTKEGVALGKYILYTGYTEGSAFYTTNISPMVKEARTEGYKFYKANLAEALDPVVSPVSDVVSTLELDKVGGQVYGFGANAVGEAVTLFNAEVLPPVSKFASENLSINIATLNPMKLLNFLSWGAITGFVAQPIVVDLFDETVEFRNGVVDISILAITAVLGGYYVAYKLCFKFLFLNVFLKIFVARIVYGFLFRTVLVNLIIALIVKVLEFAWFLVLLAMCCGCCGTCFKRKKSAKSGSSSRPPQKKMGVSNSKPMNVQGVTQSQRGNKR